MRRWLLAVMTMLCLAPLVGNGVASAHVLKEDNGMSAVLHIPPDDNPVGAEETELDLSFSNDAQTFSLQDCDCQVIVKRDNRTLSTTTLTPALPGATLDGVAHVTFPSVGVYDVVVMGAPKSASFAVFRLDYSERIATSVSAPVAASGQQSQVMIIGLGAFAILLLFAVTNIKAGKRYTKHVKYPSPKE